jgi:hypothetical protein
MPLDDQDRLIKKRTMQALPRHAKERPGLTWPESQGCLAAIFSRILDVGHIISYPLCNFFSLFFTILGQEPIGVMQKREPQT